MIMPSRFLAVCLSLAGLWGSLSTDLQAEGPCQIHADVVYGHKDGMALTIDIIQPEKHNGAAVLWIQSGGWYSNWVDPEVFLAAGKPYLDQDYTLIIVRHGSAPRYQVPDAVADVRRAVRFIRWKAKDYGIDPERLGVTGGSAGGHLTLMLATTGDDGQADSKDEVLRHSSRIAAGVALYPPTDLRGWTTNPPQVIRDIPSLKPPLQFEASLESSVSPILHISDTSAPILMIHGDKDELVPVEHSTKMEEALKKTKAMSKLVVVQGASHGYSPQQQAEIVGPETFAWFAEHLKATIPTGAGGAGDLPKTVMGRLKQEFEIEFSRKPLQEAIAFIGEEAQVTFIIDGDALKMAGYTKNMPQTFTLGKAPGTKGLYTILTWPQQEKMCLVVDDAKMEALITTTAAAEAKGQKVVPVESLK